MGLLQEYMLQSVLVTLTTTYTSSTSYLCEVTH